MNEQKTFAERCKLSEQCLPDAPYRAMLTALHNEMLAALEQQPADEPVALAAYDKIDRFLRNILGDDDYAEYSEALDTLYTRPQPAGPAIPEGMKLVPVEPTHEMKKAGIEIEVGDEERIVTTTFAEVDAIYRAMLAAAPQQKDTP